MCILSKVQPLDTPLVRGMQLSCSPQSCYAPDAAYNETQQTGSATMVFCKSYFIFYDEGMKDEYVHE